MIKREKLTQEQNSSEYILTKWAYQSEETVTREINNVILREKLPISNFCIKYQNDPNNEQCAFETLKKIYLNISKERLKISGVFKISALYSLIHSLIPFFYRFYIKDKIFDGTIVETYLIFSSFLINFVFFQQNFIFIINGYYDLNTKCKALEKLTQIINFSKNKNKKKNNQFNNFILLSKQSIIR